MSHAKPDSSAVEAPAIAITLRRLAAELRSDRGAPGVLGAMAETLRLLPGFETSAIVPVDVSPGFADDGLTLPLVAGAHAVGILRVAPVEGRPLGREQLRLASAVADLASAVLGHPASSTAGAPASDILMLALGKVSEGIACFDARGALIFANANVHRLFGGWTPDHWQEIWPRLAPATRREPGVSFVQRDGARLLHVMSHRPVRHGCIAVVATDLAPRVEACSEMVAAESYRAMAAHQRLAIAVLVGAEGSTDALDLLENCRGQLPSNARIGPIEAEAAIVVAPGLDAGALTRVMVPIGEAGEKLGVRIGAASLQGDGDSPEALLARAISSLAPMNARGRATILVLDRSPSVADTLALVLRRDCAVTCVNGWDKGLELLSQRMFDGMILELPATWDSSAADGVRSAISLQPAARPFFITDLPGPWNLDELGLPSAPVFRKPFVVGDIRATLKTAFGSGV